MGTEDDRRREPHGQGDQAVPETARLPQERQGPHSPFSTPTCTACASAGTRPSANARTPGTRPRWKRSPRPIRSTNSSRWRSSSSPASSRARGTWSRRARSRWPGQNAFPESPGGKLCFNLIQEIEAKSSQRHHRAGLGRAAADINVSYRNITKIYFRVVQADYIDRLKKAQWRPEYLNQNEAQALLSQDPVLTFNHDLPATPDYKTRTEIDRRAEGAQAGLLLPPRQPRRPASRATAPCRLHRLLRHRSRHRRTAGLRCAARRWVRS